MKRFFQSAAMLAAMAIAAPAMGFETGLARLVVADDDRAAPLEGFAWYPTTQQTGQAEFHGNPVWQGIMAVEGAAPAPGRFPLVVLSHGMYGNAMNQSWLADALARRGYVVMAVNHAGSSTWLRDPDDARRLWLRPGDISALIDHALGDAGLAAHIDAGRVFMAGHSLGGFTAVALAGGRYDAVRFDGFCGDHPGELVCGIMQRWHVAQTSEDRAQLQRDLSDDRIKGFAVFDLGGTQTFSPDSLAAIDRPMLVIGAPRDIDGSGLDLSIESRALAAALPPATTVYDAPEGLSHFDFMGECRAEALDILKAEEPDDVFVCVEGGAQRRRDHQAVIDKVTAFFDGL